jgi:hypothetical protein
MMHAIRHVRLVRPWHGRHWPHLLPHALSEPLALLAFAIATACSAPAIPLQPATGYPSTYGGGAVVQAWRVQPASGRNATLNLYADGMLVVDRFPWFHQGPDQTCAQANIASLLNFWGVPLSYPTVVRQMNPGNLPTDVGAISTYLRQKGLRAQDYRSATVNFVRAQVNAGRPTLVLLDFGNLASTHYVTVKGYDRGGRRLLINDPVVGANTVMPVAEFERRWQNPSLSRLPGVGDRYRNIAFVVAAP